MKKRVWGILLALTLCAAALCVSAGAADETQQESSVAKLEYTYSDGSTLIKYHDTLDEAFQWVRGGVGTITLLQDLEIDAPLRIDQNVVDDEHPIVLDLGGHTLSANVPAGSLAESAVIYMNPATTSRFTVQNGTIQNLADDGIAIYVADGELSLKNMTVEKDIVIQEMYCYYTNANIAPKFFSGAFGRIRLDTGHSILLSKILGKGSYALMGGVRLDKDQHYDSLEKITFMACDHKDIDGNYTLFKPALTKYGAPAMRCTVCGNLCPHDKIGADLNCTVCKLPIAIKATNLASGKDLGPYYYTGLDDAMNEILHVHAGRRPVLKLLADVESACNVEWRKISDDGLTIDLAGHTLTLTGNKNKACSERMKFLNTSDTPAKVLGTVNVDYDHPEMKLTITDNNLTIENLLIGKCGTAELAGGSFGTVTVAGGKKLSGLLAPGYCFTDSETGAPVKLYHADKTVKTELTNVTVAKCDHNTVFEGTDDYGKPQYRCPCGQVIFAASVTKNETTTYYDTLQKAVDAAENGDTVKVLNKFLDKDVTVSKDVTLDLSGQRLQYNGNSGVKAPHLIITGNVTLFSGDDSSMLAVPVDVKSGGTLTVPKELGGVQNVLATDYIRCTWTVESSGTLTLSGGTGDYGSVSVNGGKLTVDGVSFSSSSTAVYLQENSTAVISGGTIPSLILIGENKVTISGGSFGSITIYETYYDQNGQLEDVWPHTVTYADFAGLLTDGKAFRLEDGSWANDTSVESPSAGQSASYKTLKPVTVADAPVASFAASVSVAGVDQGAKAAAEYGELSANGSQVNAKPSFRGETAPVNQCYQWYLTDKDGARTEIVGAVAESLSFGGYAETRDLTPGVYTFVCMADFDGFVCYSTPATVTVTPRVLWLPMVSGTTDAKVYDGTTKTDFALAGFYADAGKTAVTLTENVDFTLDSASYESPAASGAAEINWSATLLNPNYVFPGGVRTTTDVTSGRIDKAPAPTVQAGALTVANDQAAAYSFDFKSLLRTLEAPLTYGEISYSVSLITMDASYYDVGTASLTDGVLTLPIQAASSASGEVGTVTVKVSTQNYEDITLTVNVSAVNKKLPVPDGGVTLSRSALTYGQTLDTISLSGVMKCGGQVVAGAFAWQEPDAKLNAGSHTVGWVFTPNDTSAYLSATGTAAITVNKATPSGAPKYTAITASGKKLSDAGLDRNASWPAGTVKWVGADGSDLADTTEVKANTAYKWVFTPADTANYTTATGTITLYSVSTGGGGGGSTTTKTETTTNPDGSVTKTETKLDGTVIETTTNPDGSVSKTESKTTTKSNGSTVETVTETNTNADGSKSTSKTETTTNKDGSKTETKSEIRTEPDGTKSETKSETKTDANGVTNGKETTKTTAPNGSTGTTTTTTENGNSKTEAEAKISNKAVEDAKKSGEAVKVPTEVKAGEDSNSAPTVKVELPKNAGETKIEIPVEDANSGTVAVIVHPDGTEEIVKDSKPTEDGIQLTVDGSTTVKIIDNSRDFIDTRDHWSRDEVNFVVARELFNGIGNNLFGVSQSMTRGMVNTVLARLAGVDTTPSAGQKWYEVGTEWAKQNGISDGTNPEASVTREQLATLLYRFSGTPEVRGNLLFSDTHEVSDYAQNALLWATQNGILNGVGSGRVAPGADAQRAQVAAMMARYLKNVG